MFVAVAATLLAVVVGGSPANAGSNPTITIDPAAVETGESFAVNGAGWLCVDDVELSIIDDATATVLGTVDGGTIVGGQFSLSFPAPSAPGVYQVSAVYTGSCGGSAVASLTVTTAPTSTTMASTTTTTTTTMASTTTAPTTTVVPANAAPTTEQAIAPATGLPATGDGNGSVAIVALLVVGLGAMLLAATRRTPTN